METRITALSKVKRIALVAHDNMKPQLLKWVLANKAILAQHKLCGTGTTGYIIEEALNIEVEEFMSGPLGGDQQLGAKISDCLLYTSPSPRDRTRSRMPSSA